MAHTPSDAHQVIIQHIQQWVRREVAFPEPTRGKCNRVVVKHIGVDRRPQGDVAQFPVKLEEGSDEIEPLLMQIAEAAQNDANDLNSGVQSYAIYAYFAQDRNYVPRKIFRVSSVDEEIERDVNPSEPPTEKGLTSQLMRHNEAIMRQMTIATGMQLQTMQRENQRLAEMNERYSQQQVDFLVLVQDLLDNATRRRLDERQQEASLAIKEEAMQKLAALVPVVINRMAGQQILPVEDKSFMLMASFLENLTDEQQQQLLNQCSDSQKMVLAEILSEYEKKKSRMAQGKKPDILTARSSLPPPPSDLPVKTMEVAPIVVPGTLPLRARLTAAENSPDDPQLKKIEEDGTQLMSRFRDLFKPSTQ